MRGSSSQTVNIKAELTLRVFRPKIYLTNRCILPLSDNHKLVNEFLHARHHFFLGREGDFAIIHVDGTFGYILDALAQNLNTFTHLKHTDYIPVVSIPLGANRYLKIEPIIDHVGIRPAYIVFHTTAAEVGA